MTGGKVATALGHKAEAGARTLYEFITKLREKSASAEKAGTKAGSEGTLTSTDMAPAWHAPVPLPPRRDAREGRHLFHMLTGKYAKGLMIHLSIQDMVQDLHIKEITLQTG